MNACSSPKLQRSHGLARVGFCRIDAVSRLQHLQQSGSAKAFCHPTPHGPEVVFLNTSGGMTGGDRLGLGVDLGPGCHVTATTQTAERAYRCDQGQAVVTVTHHLGADAHLDWLPQETIFFQGASLARRTTVHLAKGASCLLLESGVLGRAAMGETLTRLTLSDRREVWRGDHPLMIEPLALTDATLTAGAALLQGARAFASLALVAPDAEPRLDAVRAVLDQPGVTGGASALDGRVMIRLLAQDGWPLRRQILRLLAVLRAGPAPRVWQM